MCCGWERDERTLLDLFYAACLRRQPVDRNENDRHGPIGGASWTGALAVGFPVGVEMAGMPRRMSNEGSNYRCVE